MAINLLPWRERAQQHQLSRWHRQLVRTVALAMFCGFGLHFILMGQLETQRHEFRKHSHALAQLQQQHLSSTQSPLMALSARWQQLEQRRHQQILWAQFLSQLPDILPATVTLTALTRQHEHIELTGMVSHPDALETLNQALKQWPVVEQLALLSSHRQPAQGWQFHLALQLRQAPPS